MSQQVEQLLRRSDVWRARRGVADGVSGLKTGFPALDRVLPSGGWPLNGLTEVLSAQPGAGEMSLILPALARISRQQWVVCIAPPYIPYAPALAQAGVQVSRVLMVQPRQPADALWAAEQALREGCCGAVLLWPTRVDLAALRRLQLAAEQGGALAVMLRGERARQQPSMSSLRLQVEMHEGWLKLDVLKARGGHPGQLRLPLTAAPFRHLSGVGNRPPVLNREAFRVGRLPTQLELFQTKASVDSRRALSALTQV